MKVEREILWCCKYCGAGYQELPDDINGCQECGTANSLIKKKVYVDDVLPDRYFEHPFIIGSKGQITLMKTKLQQQGSE